MSDTSNPTVADLRRHLFATLEGLRDKSNPMDLERARVVADVAQVVINTAKVEVELVKTVGGKLSLPFLQPTIDANGTPKLPGAR